VRRSDRFLNRDLSRLASARRLLEAAAEPSLPLLERVGHAAAAARDVDEFFAVRAGSLRRGLEPAPLDTLVTIRDALGDMHATHEALWLDELRPALADERIRIGPVEECGRTELQALTRRFEREIQPLLTPIAVGPGAPFPYVPSLALSVGVLVRDDWSRVPRFVRVNVPAELPRFLEVGSKGRRVPVGEAVVHFLPALLGDSTIESAAVFRLTRDVEASSAAESDDLSEALTLQLRRRRFGAVVRLEIGDGASTELLAVLRRHLQVEDDQVYVGAGPLGAASLAELVETGPAHLRFPRLRPQRSPFQKRTPREVFERIRRRDVLLHQPFVPAAAADALIAGAVDAKVVVVKTTLSTGGSTKTLRALAQGARSGKEVVCVGTPRPTIDDRAGTDWVVSLDRAGADIVTGAPGWEVHGGLDLLVRRERGRFRGYVRVGGTAADEFTLLTADADIAADAADLFNSISALAAPAPFRKLLVGPWFLRDGLLREILRVAEGAAAGAPARIRIKVDELTDRELVNALYAASTAGVSVEVTCRVCTLRPGVPGLSDGIVVQSVVGHLPVRGRSFWFQAGDDVRAYIGSADLTPAALDERIEVLVPVADARRRAMVASALDVSTEALVWTLGRDGTWERHVPARKERAGAG
jgi:polyphosphate kinase